MYLELKDIKSGALEQYYSCTESDFPGLVELSGGDVATYVWPAQFHLRFQKTGQLIQLDGQLSVDLLLKCGRCLQAFNRPVREIFALTFAPASSEHEELKEVELEADELSLVVYEDETLNFADVLQEQLIMAVPISPVCCSGCLGLCPGCGAHLNKQQCSCAKKVFNNKFSVLAGVKLNS